MKVKVKDKVSVMYRLTSVFPIEAVGLDQCQCHVKVKVCSSDVQADSAGTSNVDVLVPCLAVSAQRRSLATFVVNDNEARFTGRLGVRFIASVHVHAITLTSLQWRNYI